MIRNRLKRKYWSSGIVIGIDENRFGDSRDRFFAYCPAGDESVTADVSMSPILTPAAAPAPALWDELRIYNQRFVQIAKDIYNYESIKAFVL